MKKLQWILMLLLGVMVVVACAPIDGLDNEQKVAPTTKVMTTAAPKTTAVPVVTEAAIDNGSLYKFVRIKADALNVRSIGAMEGTVLTKIYDGQVYEVLDAKKDNDGLIWYKVEAPGDIFGWVSSDYCIGGDSKEALESNE